jgi:hypothetical protein
MGAMFWLSEYAKSYPPIPTVEQKFMAQFIAPVVPELVEVVLVLVLVPAGPPLVEVAAGLPLVEVLLGLPVVLEPVLPPVVVTPPAPLSQPATATTTTPAAHKLRYRTK